MPHSPAHWAAVIVAAGRGTRFGRPKQFLELAGLPMAAWSLRVFNAMPEIAEIAIVTEAEWIERMRGLVERYAGARATKVVAGGRTRQESVYRGLLALLPECDAVLVHDGARPLVRERDVRAAMMQVAPGRAAVLAVPVVDTIKAVDPATMTVRQTLDRGMLWAVQTPQLALAAELRRAHEHALERGVDATDDAALLEAIGIDVAIVPSTSQNFKVTLPEDVARAEAFLRERVAAASATR